MLDEVLAIRKKIKNLDERIFEIRSKIESPKNQIISDMPRGGSGKNILDKLLDKVKRLETKRTALYVELASEWHKCEIVFKSCNISERHKELMKLHYYEGLSWRYCERNLKRLYPYENWNENKVFRINRITKEKIYKKINNNL